MNTNTQPTNQQPQHSNCSILRNQSPGTALMLLKLRRAYLDKGWIDLFVYNAYNRAGSNTLA
ncbi:uncharacterized protein N7506_003288 [Penicillium brevicompactum]|uniref:uncharacterized protein n=1 Tax=Penicillium brevicompactum TaxID=5074 RepID=UPI0025416DC1|nr:uncharacterized protein N7506_003288 [Penicillium brevicompactum]KAJ5343464.1 hypothetical protein N7506_003288 [Penicillium brevicompactum]